MPVRMAFGSSRQHIGDQPVQLKPDKREACIAQVEKLLQEIVDPIDFGRMIDSHFFISSDSIMEIWINPRMEVRDCGSRGRDPPPVDRSPTVFQMALPLFLLVPDPPLLDGEPVLARRSSSAALCASGITGRRPAEMDEAPLLPQFGKHRLDGLQRMAQVRIVADQPHGKLIPFVPGHLGVGRKAPLQTPGDGDQKLIPGIGPFLQVDLLKIHQIDADDVIGLVRSAPGQAARQLLLKPAEIVEPGQ